jgi:hypothetical protein
VAAVQALAVVVVARKTLQKEQAMLILAGKVCGNLEHLA